MKYDKKFAAIPSRCYVDKFIVLKHIGNNIFVEREFDDETLAKEFVNALRKSEKLDFITYEISHVLDY